MDRVDLKCYENIAETKAYVDPTLLDKKVFENLKYKDTYIVTNNIQQDVTVEMRKIVIVWMKEVTEEQNCQLEVFLLSVNYMNRFLNICQIKRNQLQLLGTACMLIASKLRESKPLNASLLIFYTDNSITLCDLLQFEQLILSKLKWDIVVVTPSDFLQHILPRISLEKLGISAHEIEEKAKALISYCTCEHIFWEVPSSLVAISCIAAALLPQNKLPKNYEKHNFLFNQMCTMTNIEPDFFQQNLKNVEDMIYKVKRTMAGECSQDDYSTNDSRKNEFTTPPLGEKSIEIETASTPTDVHDIDF